MKINFDPFPILKSERLILKQLSFSHEQALYDYQSNKDNFPYVDMPVYKSIEDAKNYVIQMHSGVDQNKWIVWAICLKDSEEIIGTISIWNLNQEENKAELGYGIFPLFRRKGYMKEALQIVVNYGFEIMKLDLIEAYTSHYNRPSIDFLHAFGFEFEKTIEDDYMDGALMDIFKKNRNDN